MCKGEIDNGLRPYVHIHNAQTSLFFPFRIKPSRMHSIVSLEKKKMQFINVVFDQIKLNTIKLSDEAAYVSF